jgi:uncharacterized protein DUF5953
MAVMQSSLILIVYAPELTGDDSRPLAVVHGMERALPGLRLEWTVSDDHQIVHLPQRDAWLAQARRNGGFPLVHNNDERYPVMISGLAHSARSGPGGHALLDVNVELPLDPGGIAAATDVLEAVAEGACAFWGRVLPAGVAVTVAEQFRHPGNNPHAPPKGLPSLKLPWELPAPEIPHYLGWLNYWSAATARAIGFPDPARDAELLSRARRTPSGGWVVQLTDAPLDLDNPAHLDALKRAYEHFPAIGGRTTP